MFDTIPIFPLGLVLMPGAPLPLHIFEERYRAMLREVSQGTRAFGVLCSADGSGDLATVGTLAEIIEIAPYPDGTSDLLTVGSQRFRVEMIIDTGAPYLRAQVEFLPEDEGKPRPGLVYAARELTLRYVRTLAVLTGRPADEDLPRDAVRMSYEVATRLQLTIAERQALLEAPTAAERLEAGLAVLRRETILLARTRTVSVAPHILHLSATAN